MGNLLCTIEKFYDMLHDVPDDHKSIYEFYNFFKSLSFVPSKNIPFVELGTILKHKKPVVYYGLKPLSEMNHIIQIITSVDMDLEKAIENINSIIDEGSR